MKLFCIILFFTLNSIAASSDNVPAKGLLSEIRLNEKSEDENQKKSFKSEVMITKAENKAIESLKQIIKKKAGKPEEADLLNRLAELYMRRSKSGRYFDLEQSSENKLQLLGLKNQHATDALKQAIQIYSQILNRFPHYSDLDYVHFNNALANSQLKNFEVAKKNYLQLISQFPNSELVPDALLEVGEIFYQQQNFQSALEKFKAIEKFPNSTAYPYGLYKSAWCYYNMKNTDAGIQQLTLVVKQNPADQTDIKKFNLRKEALRDLTLFVGETLPPKQLVSFFKKICTEDELGESIYALTGLYESHSRHKELLIFVDEFISDFEQNKRTPLLFTKLIDTFETLKQRDIVITKLTQMAQFCRNYNDSNICRENFKKISLEISKKWWDIWLKNKNNIEFSQLTEKAFENLLSIDDEKNPDSKSRFAFAELLFQQNKFAGASMQYEIVSKHITIDNNLKHDALYGALFSIEKQLVKLENETLIEKQKQLALRYIAEFKNGEHFNHLTYKLGYISYKQSLFELSLNYLEPLVKTIKESELKTKSEDIILDIYNLEKDYVTLQKYSALFAKTSNPERKKTLEKIQEEAHYAQTQLETKNLDPQKQIDLLMAFSKSHQESKLAQDAFWQSISIAYSSGFDVLGADLSLRFVKEYPNETKNIDAIKEAIKAYLDSGRIDKAIGTLQVLATFEKNKSIAQDEVICDLIKLQFGKDEASKCFLNIFNRADNKSKNLILAKLLSTISNTESNEYKNIQNTILQLNIEPYATEALIKQANNYLNKKEYKQAFSLSLKINARPVDESMRAAARLIQAKILENEFVNQSVKAREDKLALVIAMKTEKLDKSFTAYSAALKMAASNDIQAECLLGIERLYVHFIDAISGISLPDTLSAADQLALKKELVNVVSPFEEKRKSNSEKLKALNVVTTKNIASDDWTKLSIEKSIVPATQLPAIKTILAFLPTDLKLKKEGNYIRMQNNTQKCNEGQLEATNINSCLLAKNYKAVEKLALELTATQENRSMGLYYLSLVADAQNNPDKAIWLANKSLEKNTTFSLAEYQKMKVQYSVEDFNSAFKLTENLINTKENISEVFAVAGSKHFSEREYKKANVDFSRLSTEQLYTYDVDLMNIESKLQIGEIDQAIKAANEAAKLRNFNLDINLIYARIYEHFKFDNAKALLYYTQALALTKMANQREWLNKKIDSLKNNKNNQIMSYVGGQ